MVIQGNRELVQKLYNADIERFYQPIYHVADRRIDKVEVLARMRDENGEMLDAETMIGAAEELGLIDEMDRQTFIHSCNELPEFQTHGIMEMSINLSPAACHSPRLVSEVRRIGAESGIDLHSICLEITEVSKLLDEESIFEPFQALHDLGIKIALDDFGKGYSNLQRMINIPFQVLKIDKSLIWGMGKQPLATPMVENLIHFCKENDITVIAEGVETANQVHELSEMGCDYLQGYYFGKPMDKEALFHLLLSTTAALA